MKSSAGLAYLFIFLFFLFFNGLQVYLIVERIAEAKNKFRAECSSAMMFTLSEYHKLNALDSAAMPKHAWVTYSREKIELSQPDSQNVNITVPSSSLAIDSVDPIFLETILNSRTFKSIDLPVFDTIFQKTLRSKNVQTDYRLDTFAVKGKRLDRQQVPLKWEQKKRWKYAFSTPPNRLPYNSNIFVFAEVKNDAAFIRNDLVWSMLAFAAILLIGNTALVFVYKTIRKQKRINEVKTDFINNMTHEMKTPITIASAGLDALEHHISPTERIEFYLRTSKKQLHLLNDFVERILDAAVQDIPDYNLKKERLDLHALFEELIQSHSVIKEKQVSFSLTGDAPAFIYGDKLHLETAFHNMIDNAIRYSNAAVNITIDIADNSREAIIKIRDNGIGIPPQFVRNIFEKFFRVPQGDAQSVKGFGLGLYYVAGIIKKHSGTIAVHSKAQRGTEFIITLPNNA